MGRRTNFQVRQVGAPPSAIPGNDDHSVGVAVGRRWLAQARFRLYRQDQRNRMGKMARIGRHCIPRGQSVDGYLFRGGEDIEASQHIRAKMCWLMDQLENHHPLIGSGKEPIIHTSN